jgi:hypothetical protein
VIPVATPHIKTRIALHLARSSWFLSAAAFYRRDAFFANLTPGDPWPGQSQAQSPCRGMQHSGQFHWQFFQGLITTLVLVESSFLDVYRDPSIDPLNDKTGYNHTIR